MKVGSIAWTMALVAVVGLIIAAIAGAITTGTLALASIGIALLATAISLWRGQHRVGTFARLWPRK